MQRFPTRLFTRSACLLALLVLAACASTQQRYIPELTTGHRLLVRQTFDDIANGTHLQFQHGQVIMPGNLDRWTTYCRLYVYNPDGGSGYRSAIVPGSVAIRDVKAAWHSSDHPGWGPFHAHLSWGVRDIPAYYLYQVGMRLSAPDQPDLHSLVCSKKWAVPRAAQYPTLAEIRQALGDRITIEAPG